MQETLRYLLLYRPETLSAWAWLLAKWLLLLGSIGLLGVTVSGMVRGAERQALVRRYLFRKLAPIFAVLAVTLCTAMVIIVISVMGGFLRMVMATTKTLEGEVTVSAPGVEGLAYYEELAADLEKLPEVAAATPVIECLGAVNFGDEAEGVQVLGVDPARLNRVVDYQKSLYWKTSDFVADWNQQVKLHPPRSAASQDDYARYHAMYGKLDPQSAGMTFQVGPEWVEYGKLLKRPDDKTPVPDTGIVLGMHVCRFNRRDSKGQYHLDTDEALGRTVRLSVMPLSTKGGMMNEKGKLFTVVNEFKSGLFDIDKNRVYVPFDVLQKMLQMDSYPRIDPETDKPTGEVAPARASQVLVKGKDGVDLTVLKTAVQGRILAFIAAHPEMNGRLTVQTWKERHASFIGAVEKEKFMVTILFAIVGIVAFAMIAVVFYMIVLEKTRDIGTLRAIGVSRTGIASVFLGYGLVVGVLGAGLGLGLAASIVWNINGIQDFLGKHVGFEMWNPEIYYFDRIPSQFDTTEVTCIIYFALVSSVLWASIPAWLAARVNPVESLRYE
jgi:lipoprotein-releasing system permease protein